MARYYIVSASDADVTKTDDAVIAATYEENDDYIVIDTSADVVRFQGEETDITDEEGADDPPEDETDAD